MLNNREQETDEELIRVDEGEWWYLLGYIDEKLRYALHLLHNHQDTIKEGDMMMVYTTINEVISRIETINEIKEDYR